MAYITVRITFRGLEDLNVIHDPLEHGAVLFYSERVGLSEPEIQHRLTPKEQLPIFQSRTPNHVPNYMPKDIADRLRSAGFDEPYRDDRACHILPPRDLPDGTT